MTQRSLFATGIPRSLPATVAECPLGLGELPCPYVTCRHHLLLNQDVRWNGNRMIDGLVLHPAAVEASGPDIDEWSEDQTVAAILALPETCSLDVASEGGIDQTKVAEAMGLGRTLAEKIEHDSINRLKAKASPELPLGSGSAEPRTSAMGGRRVVSKRGTSGGTQQGDLFASGLPSDPSLGAGHATDDSGEGGD